MNIELEYCNPFDGKSEDIWMKIEHCGRYLYAYDILKTIFSPTVLDAACADGYGSRMLSSVCAHVIGMDCNDTYLTLAKSQTTQTNVSYYQVDFDIQPLPLEDNSLDAVVCFETIEHVEHPERLLGEIQRVLKPEGLLLLSFPNAAYEKLDEFGNNRDPFHKHIFQKEEILSLLVEAGFSLQIGPLGQSLCNTACSNQSKCQKEGLLTEQETNRLFFYDEEAIQKYARFLGYPDNYQVEDSYSYLIEAIKKP